MSRKKDIDLDLTGFAELFMNDEGRMTVENAELRQQYEKAWEQFSVTDVENMSSAERQQWDDREKACTMFTCSVEPQFDSFTAVINSDYADFFDNTVNTLHFHEIEP